PACPRLASAGALPERGGGFPWHRPPHRFGVLREGKYVEERPAPMVLTGERPRSVPLASVSSSIVIIAAIACRKNRVFAVKPLLLIGSNHRKA
ncbi:MAG: hypothetical protein MUP03_04585, partial [Anaerolineales bacterium]|nr:hypothetical protein [Anaerolineales bacterium]